MNITLEAIRAAGGIVHSDGNIFFRDISMLQGLAGAAPAAVAGPAWDKTRDSLATLLLGLARRPFLDFDVACIALDAATEPGMPLAYMRGAPAAPALEAPAAGARWGCEDRSAWFALAMGAAASLEDAANCLRDKDAQKAAMGAATHVRESCNKLWWSVPALEAPAAPAPAVPDDWRLVRANPTDAMLGAAQKAWLADPLRRSSTLYAAALAAAPQAPAAPSAGNWIAADDVDRLVRDLDVALHGEADAAAQASLCDIVGLTKAAASKLGRPVLAAPAAPSGLPTGWVPCILTHDGQHPEEVAYGPQIMMDRLKKWLGRYFELLAQKVLAEPVQAEMLAAMQAVAMDVVHVGAGENTISDAARAKVEAVLEKIGAPWPGPAAAPAAPVLQLPAARAGRIYVAGPMTGLPDHNFPAFNSAAAALRAKGWHVENPAEHGILEGAEWADYQHYDMGRLATCSAVHLLPGWSKSRGAVLEVHVATTLGMPIFYADGAEPVGAAPAAPAVDASDDKALLDFLWASSCDLRSIDVPTGGDDSDVHWRVIEHYMSEPREREIGRSWSDDPREAIRAAIAAQAKEGGAAA